MACVHHNRSNVSKKRRRNSISRCNPLQTLFHLSIELFFLCSPDTVLKFRIYRAENDVATTICVRLRCANVCYARKLPGFVNSVHWTHFACIGTTIERIMALCYLPSMRMQILWAVKLAISMQVHSFWKFYELKRFREQLARCGVDWQKSEGISFERTGLQKTMSGNRIRVNWIKFWFLRKSLRISKNPKYLMFFFGKQIFAVHFSSIFW